MENNEKRAAKRMDINVRIKLSELYDPENKELEKGLDVKVVNVSRFGMAFISEEDLNLESYYDTEITIWTKDKIDTIIEIVRKESLEDNQFLYGCKFIGMVSSDILKIQIYEMFNEKED